MKGRHWAIACLAIAAAIPLSAAAEEAFTMRRVDVFAGPSSEYPVVGSLPRSAAVDVFGCLSDWSWCDVGFAGDRGWVYALDLAVPYEGRRVVILDYGPRIHLPVVVFSLNTYWDRHYHGRPWYGQRQQWIARVHIDSRHGGRAPAGHERAASAAPQASPSGPQQARSQTPVGRQAERSAQVERNTQRTERSRPAETARVPNDAARQSERNAQRQERAQPSEAARAPSEPRSRVAQSPQPERAQPREQRAPQEMPQRAQAAPATEREQHARQAAQERAAPRAEPSPRPEQNPQANRAPEERGNSRRAQQEEDKRDQSGQR
jgi:uncharacterized protein YraI